MICQVFPRIEGIARERFRALGKQIMQHQQSGQSTKLGELLGREVDWARHHVGINGARDEYEALARVLIDLAKLRWSVEEDRFGIELIAPRETSRAVVNIADYKETVRNELAPQLAEQFADESAREFIRRMEAPRSSLRKPVTVLIADGGELRGQLLEAQERQGVERVRLLENVVQPYLQLIEPEKRDEFTGHLLSDVWRYFRFTWTIPATTIPGRQLNYLVRDAAHPTHAVIGITSLCNSPLQMRDRDTALGWTADAFAREVEDALAEADPTAALVERISFLDRCIDSTLAAVEWKNLVRPQEVAKPTEEIVARLRRRAEEFASRREDALKSLHEDTPLVVQELEETAQDEPPVSDDVLGLEAKVFGEAKLNRARRAMVAKKRAALLARSLQARLMLRRYATAFTDPATTRATLAREDFTSAVITAIEGVKHLRVGANMLEITTCGAVAPYNHILGGKLVSLLMLSPQVADDYRRRYGAEAAIISSMMKNQRVVPDSRLVFLGTTSLYAHGASQYNRLRLPRGVIAPDQDEIRFEFLGYTGGFGTVQFPEETTRAVQRVLVKDAGFRDVNSIFGEGRSPKFRMMRAGLKILGFDPESVMQHHQRRCILGIRLCPQARDVLLGRTPTLPRYIEHPDEFRDSTSRIAAFWRERWLASRLDHAPALEALRKTNAWKLSERIPVEREPQASVAITAPARSAVVTDTAESTLAFWRNLARAGHSVCSDELSDGDLDRLHVATTLEPFLIEKVRAGFSLVLTGNAGDGKTHLLRRLATELQRAGADVDLDATAVMRRGSVEPILNRWRTALAAPRPYCLAANEYPLHLLRSELRKPNATSRLGDLLHRVLSEVERQCGHRLAYGQESAAEDAQENVLVVDLSMRNPLASEFSGPALAKLLGEPALQALAASGTDTNFTWNFQRLTHPTVRARLLSLFDRLVSRGCRCTVREMWILLARLLFAREDSVSSTALSPSAWYSERLFEIDPRFALVSQLRQSADPAGISHPQWDFRLEDADGTTPVDWLADGIVPSFDRRELETVRGAARFAALKRRFYFEHRDGEESFAIEPSDARDFRELLEQAREPDDVLRRDLVGALNLCFCPKPFPGCDDTFWLWIGHRFHEQPSRCFLANQSIRASDIQVCVARLPRRLSGAFTYRPDHIVLQYLPPTGGEHCRLNVDFPLWATLRKLRDGFPRHFAAERALNRVDAFLNEIMGTNPPQGRVFVAFNNEDRLVTVVTLTNDYRQYTEVKPY